MCGTAYSHIATDDGFGEGAFPVTEVPHTIAFVRSRGVQSKGSPDAARGSVRRWAGCGAEVGRSPGDG